MSLTFTEAVEDVGQIIEGLGVAVISIAVIGSLVIFVIAAMRPGNRDAAYRDARRNVGRGVLLGLEILVAGDIIRTVAVDPSFSSVAILAGIVLIRTFLSFTIDLEVNGTWPWQGRPDTES